MVPAQQCDIDLMLSSRKESHFQSLRWSLRRKTAYAMLKAGADRLGVSKVPQIVNDDTSIISASKRNQPPKF